MKPNPSTERTGRRPLRALWPAAHVARSISRSSTPAIALPAAVRLTWPLPALGAWALSWGLFIGLGNLQAPRALAIAAAVALGAACSNLVRRRWRRLIVGFGFPLSLAASGLGGGLPAWAWLLPLTALVFVYPLRAWRDAPLFPTPRGALDGLAASLLLAPGAQILDAGCGLGDGLRELRLAYPQAQLSGIEWSWPLRLACAWRCRFARIRRGDIWAADWSAFDLVYLFQRPESMTRAAQKAAQELRPGAWLASLEFEVPVLAPTRVFACPDGRRLWLYRAPFRRASDGASATGRSRLLRPGVHTPVDMAVPSSTTAQPTAS